MKMILIPSTNELINAECIIRAVFNPEKMLPERVDDETFETLPPKYIGPRLNIITTELVMETYSEFDGNVKAACSISREITLHGPDAVNLWGVLAHMAILLPVTPGKEEN